MLKSTNAGVWFFHQSCTKIGEPFFTSRMLSYSFHLPHVSSLCLTTLHQENFPLSLLKFWKHQTEQHSSEVNIHYCCAKMLFLVIYKIQKKITVSESFYIKVQSSAACKFSKDV